MTLQTNFQMPSLWMTGTLQNVSGTITNFVMKTKIKPVTRLYLVHIQCFIADSLDSSGRRDFINRGTIYVYFNASNTRQSQEVEIPIVNDEYNEASESFLVLIDQSIIIPEEILVFLRDGIALVTIADDDRKQLTIKTSLKDV